jgi:hypothetical protein
MYSSEFELKLDEIVSKVNDLVVMVKKIKQRLDLYMAAVTIEREPDMCAICLGPFEESSSFKLPCGHSFHVVCIFSWFSNDVSCPVCRCVCDELNR